MPTIANSYKVEIDMKNKEQLLHLTYDNVDRTYVKLCGNIEKTKESDLNNLLNTDLQVVVMKDDTQSKQEELHRIKVVTELEKKFSKASNTLASLEREIEKLSVSERNQTLSTEVKNLSFKKLQQLIDIKLRILVALNKKSKLSDQEQQKLLLQELQKLLEHYIDFIYTRKENIKALLTAEKMVFDLNYDESKGYTVKQIGKWARWGNYTDGPMTFTQLKTNYFIYVLNGISNQFKTVKCNSDFSGGKTRRRRRAKKVSRKSRSNRKR